MLPLLDLDQIEDEFTMYDELLRWPTRYRSTLTIWTSTSTLTRGLSVTLPSTLACFTAFYPCRRAAKKKQRRQQQQRQQHGLLRCAKVLLESARVC